MPRPEFVEDPGQLAAPHTATEILGRGEENRPAKTFLRDDSVAHILSHIGSYSSFLMELLRQKHARDYHVPVEVENENGETVIEHRPEVLTDDELRQEYPAIRWWERMHREQVKHRASTEGFSVKQATQGPKDEDKATKETDGSSAGASRRNGGHPQDNPRWR